MLYTGPILSERHRAVPPAPTITPQAGRWVAEDEWPSRRVAWQERSLGAGRRASVAFTAEDEPRGAYLRVRDLETDSATLEVAFVEGPVVRLDDPTDNGGVAITVRDLVKARYSITESDHSRRG